MAKPSIIATLGTTTDDSAVLEDMIKEGVDCFRINTAYAGLDTYAKRIEMVRAIKDVPIMMDLKGSQLRLELEKNIPIEQGDTLYVGYKDEPLHFTHDVSSELHPGRRILLDNGDISCLVCIKKNNSVHLEVENPGEGILRKSVGVNLPWNKNTKYELTAKDKKVIDFSLEHHVGYFALSFVRREEDIEIVDEYVSCANKNKIPIVYVPKIEDRRGLYQLNNILQYGVSNKLDLQPMLGRGDFAIEEPLIALPYAQNQFISVCRKKNVRGIVGTGFLESMQQHATPSRAEVNDVYLALSQGAEGFMLSGETSNSKHPVLAVKFLKSIIDLYGSANGGYDVKR